MSKENVERAREAYDAFNRGDYESWIAHFSEDVELHDLAETPDTGVFHGHAGARKWLAKLEDAWGPGGMRLEPRGFTEGEGVVVGHVHASATGVRGGVPIEMALHIVVRLRDQKVVWMKAFLERSEALEAAGLRE
jgi:ketosteroid isomerase-like protein